MRSSSRIGLLLVSAAVLVGCDPTATVNFRSGELRFVVGAGALALPAELRADTTILSIGCAGDGTCPSTAAVPVRCEASMCDPVATTLVVPVGDVVDFEAIRAEAPQPFSRVEEIHVRAIDYTVLLNTLTIPIGPVELLWAPEGAASGMTRLGTIAPLAPKTTVSDSVALDPAGEQALSDFVVGTSPRVRFFASTVVDLEPGGPFPDGDLEVGVVMSVTAIGPLLE
jgi:hypothetical protein